MILLFLGSCRLHQSEVNEMGSTIYSQKLKHPVYVTYTCEHCGQVNTFSQDIVGNASAEVRFGTSNKYAQSKISKLGSKAQGDLDRQIRKVQNDHAKKNYAWLKVHKCSKCKNPQSWQKSSLWQSAIGWFILDILYLYVFFIWATGSSAESRTSGAWIGFILVGIVLFIPIVLLVLNLRKIKKTDHNDPIVII